MGFTPPVFGGTDFRDFAARSRAFRWVPVRDFRIPENTASRHTSDFSPEISNPLYDRTGQRAAKIKSEVLACAHLGNTTVVLLQCVGLSLSFYLLPVPLVFAGKVEQRLAKSAEVLEELLNIPDGIPKRLLDKAECVVIIPSVKKIAIGFGGSYGRGAMTCRGGAGFTGSWGPPAMVRLEGGNVGFQLGGQATDFLLLVMNPKGASSILKSPSCSSAGFR